MDVDVDVDVDGLHPVSLRRTLIEKPLAQRKEREAETQSLV
jgi:hypothetical protein